MRKKLGLYANFQLIKFDFDFFFIYPFKAYYYANDHAMKIS